MGGFVNQRPLTYMSNDVNDCECLTPNYLLMSIYTEILMRGIVYSIYIEETRTFFYCIFTKKQII